MNHVAQNRSIMGFGAQRAQGPDAAMYGARAAMIGGCTSTSNLQTANKFNIPAVGIMTHAWVESFSDKLGTFQAWTKVYPDKVSSLVDIYDVLKSGVPNVIRALKQVSTQGHQPVGIRIDFSDIPRLTIKAREMLDGADFPRAKITASNALDAYVVKSLLDEGAPINDFGIGERLIIGFSSPILSGAYKLAEERTNDQWTPRIKVSDSRRKITLPGNKRVRRIYQQGNPHQAIVDVAALADEHITAPLKAVNASSAVTHANRVLTNFNVKSLTQEYLGPNASPIENDLFKIQQLSMDQAAGLPEATKRSVSPDQYLVCLTAALAELQGQLVIKVRFTEEH